MIKRNVKGALDRLGVDHNVVRYRAELFIKRLAASALGILPVSEAEFWPSVTLFVTNTNNRYPLELTLRTLTKHTAYPNYEIWVADNASDDDSRIFLENAKEELPITRILRSNMRLELEDWLDRAMREIETPFWFGIDEDMIFLGRDWLKDMMSRFLSDESLYLLGGEHVPPSNGQVEPVSKEIVDAGEMPSTWIFGVRTALRDRVNANFQFYKGPLNLDTGHRQIFDTGGKLLSEMRAHQLYFSYMPRWFRFKYHHVGHMSWVFRHDIQPAMRDFKMYQLDDIKRRVVTGQW